MIDKEKLKRRFSRNAKQYDSYANVQKKMGDRLITTIINENRDFNNILEVGCGTGYVTRQLARLFPNAVITAVDIAPGMIDHAKSTMNYRNVDFACGDIEELQLSGGYDLIISNATFQWLNLMEETLGKLMTALTPQGTLCFSTFGSKTFRELHEAYRKARGELGVREKLTPGQDFDSLEDLKYKCFRAAVRSKVGIVDIRAEEDFQEEHYKNCLEFLYSVKKVGANNSQADCNMVHGFIDKVIEIYDQDYQEGSEVRATYHNLFVAIKRGY